MSAETFIFRIQAQGAAEARRELQELLALRDRLAAGGPTRASRPTASGAPATASGGGLSVIGSAGRPAGGDTLTGDFRRAVRAHIDARLSALDRAFSEETRAARGRVQPVAGGGAAGRPGPGVAPAGGRAASVSVTIQNDIDARGMSTGQVTQAAGQDLAELSRRLLTSGSVA